MLRGNLHKVMFKNVRDLWVLRYNGTPKRAEKKKLMIR